MAAQPDRQSAGIVGVGVAACAACCAPPILGFLLAAGATTLVAVAVFGVGGLVVLALAAFAYRRRSVRARTQDTKHTDVPVVLGRRSA